MPATVYKIFDSRCEYPCEFATVRTCADLDRARRAYAAKRGLSGLAVNAVPATWEKVRAYRRGGITVTLEAWRAESGLYRLTYDNAETGDYVARNVRARDDAAAIAKMNETCRRIESREAV